MNKKTEKLLTRLFLALGILLIVLPILVVEISGRTFSKTQAALFSSGSLFCLLCVCGIRLIAGYTREKKLNVFLLCTIIAMAAVGISVWF